jgi:hypothetical protein
MDYFYDGQVRRYLVQFMRIFSSLKIRNGPDENGMYSLTRVPVVYGDPSNMVAQLIKGQSENTLLPSPMMSVYIDSIKMAPNRRQDTQYVQPASSIEREFDTKTQTYGTGPGIRYQVERYMPVPYDIYFKLDIWTTNVTNKLQLLEQIWMIFNPSLMLQQNSNIFDWTSIFEVWLEDVTWTNRSIPQGGDIQRDVASLRFKVPVWINPPAKVKRSSLISEIVDNIYAVDDLSSVEKQLGSEYYDPFSFFTDTPIQIITTIGDYEISVAKGVNGDEITLLHPYSNVLPVISWDTLIKKYGKIEPNITNIQLKFATNFDVTEFNVIGTIEQDPTRPNVLLYTPDPDTLPADTMLPITEIIDPVEMFPGHELPIAIPGQRYLLIAPDRDNNEPAFPPGVPTSPWGTNIVAYPNDIIQYNGSAWEVVFDSKNATGTNYVVNNSNGSQYMFQDGKWAYSYYGRYAPGYWRLDNLIKEVVNTCPPTSQTINDNIPE